MENDEINHAGNAKTIKRLRVKDRLIGFKRGQTMAGVDRLWDQAVSASMSAAVYTDGAWMISEALGQRKTGDSIWRVMGPDGKASEEVLIQRASLLSQWIKKPDGLDDAQGMGKDPMNGKQEKWSLRDGVFYFGELAAGALVQRERLDGSTVLELSFRGTEANSTGDEKRDKENFIKGYALSAYKDMQGHYERHRILIDKTIELANAMAQEGKKVCVTASGHSLGGAMAQFFMRDDASRLNAGVEVKGCTFGSPGIGREQSAFGMMVRGCARLLMSKMGLFNENTLVDAHKSRSMLSRNSGQLDGLPNLSQFIDKNDPVPKFGKLGGYEATGIVIASSLRYQRGDAHLKGEEGLLAIESHDKDGYESSRLGALLKAARHFGSESSQEEGKVAALLNQIYTAKKEAMAQVKAIERAIESPEAFGGVDAIKEKAERARASRIGMASLDAPHVLADQKAFDQSVQAASKKMMEQLALRRETNVDGEMIAPNKFNA